MAAKAPKNKTEKEKEKGLKESKKAPGKDEKFDANVALAALKADVNKQFKGKGALLSGDEITNVFILRRPTGIANLDVALGGGFPAGGVSQIIGKDGSGKDYIVNRTIARLQANYGKDSRVGLVMTELPFDKKYAKWGCGVQVAYSEDEIASLEAAEGRKYTDDEKAWLRTQTGHIEQAIYDTAEKTLEVAAQMIESNIFQLIVINSFGALLTEAEAAADNGIADKHRGGAAMPITQFMHRLHAATNSPDKWGRPNLTTIIGINQYRDNVNAGPYGNPMKQAGGYALRHGKLIDLHVEAGKRQVIEINKEKYIIGKEINWEILKGKVGCHDGPKGSYWFYFGEHGYPFGADEWGDFAGAALLYGLIEQSGAWFAYKGQSIGQGIDKAAHFLANNPVIVEELRTEIFKRAKVQFLTRELPQWA